MTEMEICSVMLHPEKKQIITKNDHVHSIFKSIDLKARAWAHKLLTRGHQTLFVSGWFYFQKMSCKT